MTISFSKRRTSVDLRQKLAVTVSISVAVSIPVPILLLQRSDSGQPRKHGPACRATDSWNHSQRRQMQHTFDFLGRMHRVVEILEEQCESDSQPDGQKERGNDRAPAIWTNGSVGRQRVIDDRDIVRLSGEHNVILFRALEQSVE